MNEMAALSVSCIIQTGSTRLDEHMLEKCTNM